MWTRNSGCIVRLNYKKVVVFVTDNQMTDFRKYFRMNGIFKLSFISLASTVMTDHAKEIYECFSTVKLHAE